MCRNNQTVRKSANGLGIFLPKAFAHEAGRTEGEEITQTVVGPEQIMIDRKKPDCEVHNHSDYVVMNVSGISVPLKRETAFALADKVETNDGFSYTDDGTALLSVTRDAGCLKITLHKETTGALKSHLKELGESE